MKDDKQPPNRNGNEPNPGNDLAPYILTIHHCIRIMLICFCFRNLSAACQNSNITAIYLLVGGIGITNILAIYIIKIQYIMAMEVPETRQSSIYVCVRVRPFSESESLRLAPEVGDEFDSMLDDSMMGGEVSMVVGRGDFVGEVSFTEDNGRKHNRRQSLAPRRIHKIVDCVDDKMIIFDPNHRNPLYKVKESVLNSMYGGANMRGSIDGDMLMGSDATASRRFKRANGNSAGSEIKFVFDKLFDTDATQREVYQSTTSSLLDSVLDGFNGTVFAYGATGCGKTYTVSGTPENPGIVFQAMEELFQKMEDLKDTKSFQISLSFLEIYNERIRDLLKPETPSQKLIIREDTDNKITVANLSQHFPTTVQEVMDLVIRGNFNRTTSPTEANEVSSRSHAVLQIHIVQKNRTPDIKEEHTFGTLSIIDLAGSERAAATKNRGARLHEGANINRSLLALGNCINALCINGNDERPRCHVPYRDSKLTRLLKFSLGGNCKTVMIVCISPSSSHYDETLNTLKYANRAKEIKTKIIRNQQSLNRHVGSYLKMITEQKKEIEELRSRENKMIQFQLDKYKLSRQQIAVAITDCVNNVRFQYTQVPKFQRIKLIKSLILCKRRFLQLVLLEMKKSPIQREDSSGAMASLEEQIKRKIKQLENKFDSPDELDTVITNARTVDLLKLREMENWDDKIDTLTLELELDYVSEQLRNDILITASQMTEKLFDEDSPLHKVELDVEGLISIDREFDEFGKQFQTEQGKKRIASNDDPREMDVDRKSLLKHRLRESDLDIK